MQGKTLVFEKINQKYAKTALILLFVASQVSFEIMLIGKFPMNFQTNIFIHLKIHVKPGLQTLLQSSKQNTTKSARAANRQHECLKFLVRFPIFSLF